MYISDEWLNRPEYNDIEAPYDSDILERLKTHGGWSISIFFVRFVVVTRPTGIDEILARHIAHLFIRDPIVIFSETIHQDDTTSNDHFEVRVHLIRRRSNDIFVNVSFCRTSNQPIGRPFVSSLLLPTHRSDGVWNSVLWKCSSPTSKTPHSQSSSSSYLALFSITA